MGYILVSEEDITSKTSYEILLDYCETQAKKIESLEESLDNKDKAYMNLLNDYQKLKNRLDKIQKAYIKSEKITDMAYNKFQEAYGLLDQLIMNR